MEKIVGIYKITSPSGRVNIGQSRDVNNRWRCYKGLHCKGQPLVYKSFKKYGVENHEFEIMQEFTEDITQEVLDKIEIIFIEQYKECGYRMMNIKEGGSKGKHAKETKDKISISNKGKKNALGVKRTDREKQLLRDSINRKKEAGTYVHPCTGRVMTPELRKKIGDAQKGKIIPKERREKIAETLRGRKQSEEVKQKRIRSMTGQKRSETAKQNMSEAQSKKPIQSECILTGEIKIHKNQRECAEYIKVNRVTILRTLARGKKGKNNIVKNYKLIYVSSIQGRRS